MSNVVVALAVDASMLLTIGGICCDAEARTNFGERGSFTWMYGGEIGRMKLAIEAAGEVERLRFVGEVEDEFAADESC